MPNRFSVVRLRADYPELRFLETPQPDYFSWRPDERAIVYGAGFNGSSGGWPSETALVILHELAHALLGHRDYDFDAELLRMETEAWGVVENELAPKYEITFDDEVADGYIRSYRDWLSARSSCPFCDAAGWQTAENSYKCPACLRTWRVGGDKFRNTYRRGSNR